MQFDLERSLEILERTPSTVTHLLRGLSPEWTQANEGPETWSPYDVLGHLVHGEQTDWVPRARVILEHGEGKPFEPFDRFGQFTRFKGWTLEDLLQSFAAERQKGLETVRGWRLTPELLARRGRHPDLGSVTLAQLLATWVVHDLGHIAQMTRVMAKQYGDATGPWKAYLPVLTRV